MSKINVFLSTSLTFAALFYLAGCGSDNLPTVNSAPEFEEDAYTFEVAENSATEDEIGIVSAIDTDSGTTLTYSITSTQTKFGINENNGSITLMDALDFETTVSYTLQVQVSDGTDTDRADVTITLTDVNEFVPEFAQTSYNFSLVADAAVGDELGKISATDSDGTAMLTYTLSGEGAGNFEIMDGTNVASGEEASVVVAANADLTLLVSPVKIMIAVSDGENPVDVEVDITITPVGMGTNAAPVFANTPYNFSLASDAADGAVVGTVSATDEDEGAMLTYSLSGTNAGHFAINSNSVASGTEVSVTVATNADLPSLTSPVAIMAEASDGVSTATANVEITITAAGINVAPVFDQTAYTFVVNEDAESGDVVDAVSATDSNAGNLLTYTLSGTGADNFEMSNTPVASGTPVQITVSGTASLDHETTTSYTLNVQASDDATPALTAAARVTINVNDVNDNDPVFTGAPYTFSVDENSPASTVVDVVVATDADTGTTLAYRITTTQTDFDINANGEITVGTSATLDFETTTTSYMLQVEASDGTNAATADVTINVNNLNDNDPVFGETAHTFEIAENLASGEEVGTVIATDADAGTTLEYSITNTQTEFDIDANTGIITVSDAAAFDRMTTSTYTLMVQVDDDTNTAMVEVTITILQPIYDADNDGLIDINNLEQLNAMRWDLDGNGVPAAANMTDYEAAFPDAATFDPTPTGYELMRDLDFEEDDSYAGVEADQTWSEAQGSTSGGWDPIGSFTNVTVNTPYTASFDGNNYTLSNLYINRGSTDGVGLFSVLSATSTVSDVGLVDVDVTGNERTGSLVGYKDGGTTAACYATGAVTTNNALSVGGLVGFSEGGSTVACYATATVTGTSLRVGGLVGEHDGGTITACYATGNVMGFSGVGGLVGVVVGSGVVTACYATGNVMGTVDIGGLVGDNDGSGAITACYATGAVTGTNSVGGLVGDNDGTTTASYFNTDNTAQTHTTQGKTTLELQTPTAYGTMASDIYMTWNADLDNGLTKGIDNATAAGDTTADDPWDFGTASQYPVLKVDFNGDGTATVAEFGSQR